MFDVQLTARAAFQDMLHPKAGPGGETSRLVITPRPGLRLATVIARNGAGAELAERVRETCGLALPQGPVRTTAGCLAVNGIGPRTWLFGEDGGTADFARRLSVGFGPAAAVSDQSDGYAVLRVGGPAARAVLGKGLAIDLHPRAFDTTCVAVTTCSHIGVTVWQVDEAPSFELALFRSYAGSFAHWLSESAAE